MHRCGIALMLVYLFSIHPLHSFSIHPFPERQLRAQQPTVTSPPVLRAKGPPAGVEQASLLLTRLLGDAFSRMKNNPGEPLRLKRFTFGTTTQLRRVIEGEDFGRYMSLPVEEYVLFDAKLMRRVDGVESTTWSLTDLPLHNLPLSAPSALGPSKFHLPWGHVTRLNHFARTPTYTIPPHR